MWRLTRLCSVVYTMQPGQTLRTSSKRTSINTQNENNRTDNNYKRVNYTEQQPLESRYTPTQTIILDNLESSFIPTSHECKDKTNDLEVMSTSSQQSRALISGRQLWQHSQLLRANKHLRRTCEACVVGGKCAIYRIWHEYGIRPHVVYIPNNVSALSANATNKVKEKTSMSTSFVSDVPSWMLEEFLLPTIVIKAPIHEIKRELLSAEYSDGFAAEFPCDAQRILPVTSLLTNNISNDNNNNNNTNNTTTTTTTNVNEGTTTTSTVRAMLVLVGLRIPSNVGVLLRAAVDMKFDSVLLINTVDALHEKVLRASDGSLFHPQLHVYESTSSESLVELLSRIASQHHLMPLLAVPSQEAQNAVSVASIVHTHELKPMLILGAESAGLQALSGHWSVPHHFVSLPLPNPHINSYNVAVAGSILMHQFRPAAQAHFAKLRKLTGENVASDLQLAMANKDIASSDN